MIQVSNRVAFAHSLVLGVALSASVTAGCSSDGTGSGGGPSTAGECTDPDGLDIFFSPMYSAFDGVHEFKIPAIVNTAGVSGAAVTWDVSDKALVRVEKDTATGGALFTMLGAGNVTVTAKGPNGLCGSAPLTITQASAADWEVGNARYNNGQAIPPIPTPPVAPADGSNLLEAGGARPACVNCHGVTGGTQVFKSVSHTPQQTGGFSDAEMVGIITEAEIPEGGYYDASVIPYGIWQYFHKWTLTEEEKRGLVVYLRSLTPKSQGAEVDFSGIGSL